MINSVFAHVRGVFPRRIMRVRKKIRRPELSFQKICTPELLGRLKFAAQHFKRSQKVRRNGPIEQRWPFKMAAKAPEGPRTTGVCRSPAGSPGRVRARCAQKRRAVRPRSGPTALSPPSAAHRRKRTDDRHEVPVVRYDDEPT